MEWIEFPGKGRNTSVLLQEFKKRFARLSTLDQRVIDTIKVLFIKWIDLRKVLEERILDIHVELSLREVLGITKKELHDSIIDLVKKKRLSTEPESEKLVEVKASHIEEVVTEDEYAEIHYMQAH